MPNMSYCRFHNTLSDLRDCRDELQEPLSSSESSARVHMVRLMAEMLEELGVDIDPEDLRGAIQHLKSIREDA